MEQPRWIEDPGHAWLSVPLDQYPDALDCGTGFGFMVEGFAMLEEDVEAAVFLDRHPEISTPGIPRQYVENFPRNMPRMPERFQAFGREREEFRQVCERLHARFQEVS